MDGYLPIEAGSNLNFKAISGNLSCSRDKNEADYDKKIAYLDMKEKFKKPHRIENIVKYANRDEAIVYFSEGDPGLIAIRPRLNGSAPPLPSIMANDLIGKYMTGEINLVQLEPKAVFKN